MFEFPEIFLINRSDWTNGIYLLRCDPFVDLVGVLLIVDLWPMLMYASLGRIGRIVFRNALLDKDIKIVAINEQVVAHVLLVPISDMLVTAPLSPLNTW